MIADSFHSFMCVKVLRFHFCYIPHIKYCLQFKRFKNYVQTNELWGEVGGVDTNSLVGDCLMACSVMFITYL